MLVDAIFLTLFVSAWCALGLLAWIGLSLRRRARGALFALPLTLLGAAAGGAATPLLGLNDGAGIGVSMLTAPFGGALLGSLGFAAWDLFDLGARLRPLARRAGARRCAERAPFVESESERQPWPHE